MEVQFSQEVKATGETVKETAKHLQETAALLAKFFFNQFKGYLSNKQATALINKGQTPDYVNVKVQGKDGFQPAVLILNPKLVKELQAGNTGALTEDSLKQNAILKYPFSKDKEPYLENISKFLSPQQLEVLKEKKMIPEPVKIDFGNGKGENQYFVGINPNTNEINLTNTKYLNIPNEYKGAVLDKSLILAGKSQETKILNGEHTNDASIFFCPRTGKLKALTDNDIKSVALDASMNVPVSKYFMIESGNKTMFVNVDEFAKHHANGALKDKSITEFLSLKDKFGDNQVKVSTSNLRQWELAAPSDKLILNITDKGKNFLIPFAEFNAQQNYLTAKNEEKTLKPQTVERLDDFMKNLITNTKKDAHNMSYSDDTEVRNKGSLMNNLTNVISNDYQNLLQNFNGEIPQDTQRNLTKIQYQNENLTSLENIAKNLKNTLSVSTLKQSKQQSKEQSLPKFEVSKIVKSFQKNIPEKKIQKKGVKI